MATGDKRAVQRDFARAALRFSSGEEAIPGYTLEEWREHLALTAKARRDGTTPPPIRIHDRDGALEFTVVYKDDGWRCERNIACTANGSNGTTRFSLRSSASPPNP